jgi:hypothetical protein
LYYRLRDVCDRILENWHGYVVQRGGAKVKDISPGCAWVPEDLTISDAAVASIFVMSLPEGIAVRFTEYQPSDLGVRAWMRRYFEDRRDKYQREMPGELEEPTGMISLIMKRSTPGDGYELVEGRVSSYPVVPEDWPEVAYAALLARAIAFLS